MTTAFKYATERAGLPIAESCDEDHAALAAACEPGTALCTIIGIDGSFSRRLGAQLAVRADGSIVGSLADGCLEQQLARDCLGADAPVVKRYGRGSVTIDFRLPCGGGLDILIDPCPDREACAKALSAVRMRREGQLMLAANPLLSRRRYIPTLAIRVFGEGPELEALARIGAAAGLLVEVADKRELTLTQPSGLAPADWWTAIVLLFHDHEWEIALLQEALESPAFYIGAQGGFEARSRRLAELSGLGIGEQDLARIRSPVGNPGGSRTPHALALAILAEVVGEYEHLRPAA